jgi:ATP-dependent helicase/nuclease subunit A
VERALATLHRFWRWTRAEPADLALERISTALALVPLAAAGDLGQTRAGAMLFAHAAVRAASIAGDSSLPGALAALEAALDEDESEAPLEPGRTDVVRVMNLHKARARGAGGGAGAPVRRMDARSRVARAARPDGMAAGYTRVTEESANRGPPTVIAQPTDWDRHAEEAARFLRAENERLLYVAATRAGDELVVGMAANPRSRSLWHSFHEWLRRQGTPLRLPEPGSRGRSQLERPAAEVLAEIDAGGGGAGGGLSYRAAPVTVRKA